jgi:hypothetical protein
MRRERDGITNRRDRDRRQILRRCGAGCKGDHCRGYGSGDVMVHHALRPRGLSERWRRDDGMSQIMGWFSRAPAPPATNLARGTKEKEHPMSHNLSCTIAVTAHRQLAKIFLHRTAGPVQRG